jgi:transcriptional regulator with XRE-family HTH domain
MTATFTLLSHLRTSRHRRIGHEAGRLPDVSTNTAPDRIVELRRRLGQRLADLRTATGMTQRDLAVQTFVDRSYISHVEHGRCTLNESFWVAADDLLDAGGELRAAFEQLMTAVLARRDTERAVLRARHRPSSEPRRTGVWDPDGAVATLRDIVEADGVDRRHFVVLSGSSLTAFAHEWLLNPAAIEAVTGRTQRVGLGIVDGLEQITAVRRRQHDALGGSAELLNAVRSDLRMVISILDNASYTDQTGTGLHAVAAEFARIAGMVAFEGACDIGVSQRFYLAGLRAAHTSGDRALGANILVGLSETAREQGQLHDAVRLAESALVGAKALTPAAAARVNGHLAVAAARAGNTAAAEQATGRMLDLHETSDPAQEPPWLYWWSRSSVLHLHGWSAMGAGRYDIAEAQYQESLNHLGAEYPIERARNLTLLATARLNLGELEGACQAASSAANLIRGHDAEWVRTLLTNFRRALEPHATSTPAIAFTTETADVLSGRT